MMAVPLSFYGPFFRFVHPSIREFNRYLPSGNYLLNVFRGDFTIYSHGGNNLLTNLHVFSGTLCLAICRQRILSETLYAAASSWRRAAG